MKMGGPDYVEKMVRGEGVEVGIKGEKYLMETIEKRERKIGEEAYKYVTKRLEK